MQADDLALLLRQNIKHFRKLAGLTQVQLAAKMGADQGQISDMERGAVRPSVEMIARLSDALGVEPHVLFARPAENMELVS